MSPSLLTATDYSAFGNIIVETLCVYLSRFQVISFPIWRKKKQKTLSKSHQGPLQKCCRVPLSIVLLALCVSRHSETSSLAFISSQQPIIESHSLKKVKMHFEKKFQSLFIFFEGKFSCCRWAASDCFFPPPNDLADIYGACPFSYVDYKTTRGGMSPGGLNTISSCR